MEQKTENNLNDEILTESATKIYAAAEKSYKKLIDLYAPLAHEKREKFRELMHEKSFGKFVRTFKSPNGLYLAVGNHNLGPQYCPMKEHIEKIKQFLSEQGENWLDAAQKILMQIETVAIIARKIQRDILFPEIAEEIAELTAEITELKERLKEKDKQLRFSLETWLYLASGIESELRQANPRIYAMMNEIGKE
jgi:hypothetical protein